MMAIKKGKVSAICQVQSDAAADTTACLVTITNKYLTLSPTL